MLTRSRSLAAPFTDAITATPTTTTTAAASPTATSTLSLPSSSNGAAPSLSVDARPASGVAEALKLQASGQSGKTAKKSLRRQKSLAELFGVVIYKSKVQLHELFFRRDRDASRDGARAACSSSSTSSSSSSSSSSFFSSSSSSSSAKYKLAAGASRGAGGGVGLAGETSAEMGRATRASPSFVVVAPPATPGPRQKNTSLQQQQQRHQPVPWRTSSHPDVSFTLSDASAAGVAGSPLHHRAPVELFCVQTRQPSEAERPVSSRSLDTLQRNSYPEGTAEPEGRDYPSQGGAGWLLRPDRGCKAKSQLVKSSSDSLCRHTLSPSPGDGPRACLSKAASDDSCFVRRKLPSPLLPRDSQAMSGDSNSSSNSSSSNPPRPYCSSGGGGGGGGGLSSICSVLDWLLVGGVDGAYNEPLLCNLGVGAIVDVTNVAPNCVPPEKKTTCPCTCGKKHFRSKLNLAVDDIEWENIEQYFHDVNAFVNGWRRRGSRVLVASYNGKSRAPALVVQYLMHYFRIPLERALAHVRSRRPQTRINPGFMRALQRLEKRLADEDALGLLPLTPAPPSFPDCVRRSPRMAWNEC